VKSKLPRLLSPEEFQRLSLDEKYDYVRTMHEFLNAPVSAPDGRRSENQAGGPSEREVDKDEDKEPRG
jgi:hypothetical protein